MAAEETKVYALNLFDIADREEYLAYSRRSAREVAQHGGREELIDAMTRYPELIQRPVVIWADRAVIARPPELLLPLLATGPDPASP